MKKIIFIILILILSTSFCYAYTWEEFISFYSMIDNHSYYNANTKNALKYFHDNAENIKTYIASQGYNLDDYNTFLAQYSSSSVPRYLYFCNVNDNCTWSKNGWDKINATFSGVEVVYFKFWNDNTISKGTEIWSNKTLTNITGLIGVEPLSTLDIQVAFQNYLKDININRSYFPNTDSLQYFADAIVGNQQITDRITFQLFTSSGDFVEYLGTDTSEVTTHRIYQLFINTFDTLINNGWYCIKVYNGDNYLFKSEDFQISWYTSPYISPGTITNNSGEVTGNINLDEINNNIANLPQNIGNTFYNSGDSGEKGIIQKVYEDLFTISEDEIDNKLQKFIDDNNFDSGEVAIVTLGFDYLKNSGDFIISWNNIDTPYFKLSGDSLNFSAFVRSNETLSNVMSYVHHILGLSLFLLLGHNMFKTLLATLGISSEIYASNKDDSKPIESVVVTTDSKGNKIQTRTIKNGNITQRWVRKL